MYHHDNLLNTFAIAASGMKTQGARLRIIMENIANVDTLPTKPNQLPYGRKTITFKNYLDKEKGLSLVKVSKIKQDKSPGHMKLLYKPNHPAANASGYVMAPNVNTIIEMADMQEASRSYQANLSAIQSAKSMYKDTIELMRI